MQILKINYDIGKPNYDVNIMRNKIIYIISEIAGVISHQI